MSVWNKIAEGVGASAMGGEPETSWSQIGQALGVQGQAQAHTTGSMATNVPGQKKEISPTTGSIPGTSPTGSMDGKGVLGSTLGAPSMGSVPSVTGHPMESIWRHPALSEGLEEADAPPPKGTDMAKLKAFYAAKKEKDDAERAERLAKMKDHDDDEEISVDGQGRSTKDPSLSPFAVDPEGHMVKNAKAAGAMSSAFSRKLLDMMVTQGIGIRKVLEALRDVEYHGGIVKYNKLTVNVERFHRDMYSMLNSTLQAHDKLVKKYYGDDGEEAQMDRWAQHPPVIQAKQKGPVTPVHGTTKQERPPQENPKQPEKLTPWDSGDPDVKRRPSSLAQFKNDAFKDLDKKMADKEKKTDDDEPDDRPKSKSVWDRLRGR